jgi:competence protein ComEA
MPTAAERQAVVFLTAVAVLGGSVRVLQSRALDQAVAQAASLSPNDQASASEELSRQMSAVEQAKATKSSSKKKGPPSEPIDVNTATAEQLDALPRVGPALAARIVADRDSLGPFDSLDALQRVKGIGPALARGLSPYVTFSTGLRPLHVDTYRGRPP